MPTPRQVTEVERVVLNLKGRHCQTWRDRRQWYWMWRLLLEVGELFLSLLNLHRHAPDWELDQIASIAMNWREYRKSSQCQ